MHFRWNRNLSLLLHAESAPVIPMNAKLARTIGLTLAVVFASIGCGGPQPEDVSQTKPLTQEEMSSKGISEGNAQSAGGNQSPDAGGKSQSSNPASADLGDK